MTFANTPVIILAGGRGTRLAEETQECPKPMVKIGDRPILWHIIKTYQIQGFRTFYVATGHLGYVIDDWIRENNFSRSWGFECKVSAVDTGTDSETGQRLRILFDSFITQKCMVTYGDGLANVNLKKLFEFHMNFGKLATVTSVKPPARFGYIKSEDGLVTSFGEKRTEDVGWINGGYFVLDREIRKFLPELNLSFEKETLPLLVCEKLLGTYRHEGFWQPMDTLREKQILDAMAKTLNPPWYEGLSMSSE